MKIICYNKATKEKETNKKCFNLTKNNRSKTDARVIASQTRDLASVAGTQQKISYKEGTKSDDSLRCGGGSLKKTGYGVWRTRQIEN